MNWYYFVYLRKNVHGCTEIENMCHFVALHLQVPYILIKSKYVCFFNILQSSVFWKGWYLSMVDIHTTAQHLFHSTPSTSHFWFALYRFCEFCHQMLFPLAVSLIYWQATTSHGWHGSFVSFSFSSGLSGTSLFNSISLMAYNVFYTSLPVMTIIFDKDISETTVLQYPQILRYSQAGRYK